MKCKDAKNRVDSIEASVISNLESTNEDTLAPLILNSLLQFTGAIDVDFPADSDIIEKFETKQKHRNK